jgi:hypothetical protein
MDTHLCIMDIHSTIYECVYVQYRVYIFLCKVKILAVAMCKSLVSVELMFVDTPVEDIDWVLSGITSYEYYIYFEGR